MKWVDGLSPGRGCGARRSEHDDQTPPQIVGARIRLTRSCPQRAELVRHGRTQRPVSMSLHTIIVPLVSANSACGPRRAEWQLADWGCSVSTDTQPVTPIGGRDQRWRLSAIGVGANRVFASFALVSGVTD